MIKSTRKLRYFREHNRVISLSAILAGGVLAYLKVKKFLKDLREGKLKRPNRRF